MRIAKLSREIPFLKVVPTSWASTPQVQELKQVHPVDGGATEGASGKKVTLSGILSRTPVDVAFSMLCSIRKTIEPT